MEETVHVPSGYIGRRFLAAIIDYSIQWIILIVLVQNFGVPTEKENTFQLPGAIGLLPIAFWLLLIIGMEQVTGATIGDGIMGLKPLSLSGGKPTVAQSLKRHLLDVADMFFFGIVAYVNIKNTKYKQRLGDVWAKTIVIRG